MSDDASELKQPATIQEFNANYLHVYTNESSNNLPYRKYSNELVI